MSGVLECPRKKNAEIILKNTTVYPFRISGNSSLMCVFCPKEYLDPGDYRSHMEEMHDEFDIKKVIILLRGTSSHIKVDCTNLHCRVCCEPFNSLDVIALHLNKKHNFNIDLDHKLSLHPYKLEPNKWACCICNMKFPTLLKLARHTSTHYLKHACDQCGRTYTTIANLKHHLRFGHGKIKCRKCFQEFSSTEEKSEHYKTSVTCLQYVCIQCGERFHAHDLMVKHKQEVHGRPVVTLKCVDCDEVFESRKRLYVHYKKAHSEDSIICSYCGERFSNQQKFTEHQVVHTGEKNYQCIECLKNFSRSKSLKYHMGMHSETKRFNCVVCNKQFNQKCSLERHMQSYHPDVEVLL